MEELPFLPSPSFCATSFVLVPWTQGPSDGLTWASLDGPTSWQPESVSLRDNELWTPLPLLALVKLKWFALKSRRLGKEGEYVEEVLQRYCSPGKMASVEGLHCELLSVVLTNTYGLRQGCFSYSQGIKVFYKPSWEILNGRGRKQLRETRTRGCLDRQNVCEVGFRRTKDWYMI